jgi:hypothetical protein
MAVLEALRYIFLERSARRSRMVGAKGAMMDWARILAYVTGTVDQELLARNEYLAAENRILKAQLQGRLKLSDAERALLGEFGHRLGRKALAEVATVARPDTILAWYRKLVAHKFDGSKARRGPGRPRITRAIEQLIVRVASENQDWGYDRIVGSFGQSRVYDFRSNGWQYSAPPWAARQMREQGRRPRLERGLTQFSVMQVTRNISASS